MCETAPNNTHIYFSVWSPATEMLGLLLKNAKNLKYSSVILFNTGRGHTYKEISIQIKIKWKIHRLAVKENDVSQNYHFPKEI